MQASAIDSLSSSRAPARVGAARPRAGCTACSTAALTPLGRSQGHRGSRHRQPLLGQQASASPLQCECRITPCLVLSRVLATLRIETSSSLPSALAALTGGARSRQHPRTGFNTALYARGLGSPKWHQKSLCALLVALQKAFGLLRCSINWC
jgi:hypothetical protein